MPKFLGKIFVKKKTLDKIIVKIRPFFNRIEKITRERLNFSSSRTAAYAVNVLLLITSIAMLAPVPVLSMAPTVAMILATFGLLNGDGIFAVVGLVTGILSVPLLLKALSYSIKLISGLS
jgi:hypothetical protein